MEIRALGHNCFRLRGKEAIVLLGSPAKRVEADIVIADEGLDQSKVKAKNRPEVFLLPGPGEYEINGVEIRSRSRGLWLLEMEKIKIAYWAKIEQMPAEKELESLGPVDLLVPVLSNERLGAKKAFTLIGKISPLIVVLAQPRAKNLLDLLDQEDLLAEDKLFVKASDLPEETKIVVLKVKQ